MFWMFFSFVTRTHFDLIKLHCFSYAYCVRSIPCVAPHDLIAMLHDYKLAPKPEDAKKYWNWLMKHNPCAGQEEAFQLGDQPLFMRGDDAQYNDYADKMMGVYLGKLSRFRATMFSDNLLKQDFWPRYLFSLKPKHHECLASFGNLGLVISMPNLEHPSPKTTLAPIKF